MILRGGLFWMEATHGGLPSPCPRYFFRRPSSTFAHSVAGKQDEHLHKLACGAILDATQKNLLGQ